MIQRPECVSKETENAVDHAWTMEITLQRLDYSIKCKNKFTETNVYSLT